MIYADIGLIPPKIIEENIEKIRFILRNVNIYGNHEPHITLYPNSFNNPNDIEKIIKKVIKHYKPFEVEIIGLKQLKDPISNTKIIVYEIKKTKILSQLQRELFEELNKIRTKDQEKWLLKNITKPSKRIIENIKRFGYPFSPDDWIFHVSIASVIGKFDLSLLKDYEVKTRFIVNEIGIFLENENELLKL